MSEAELALKIQYLEKAHEAELKARKYTHNMIEDIGLKIGNLERASVRFEADITHRAIISGDIKDWLQKIDDRQRTIERLVFIAIGGVTILGGTAVIIGGNILKLLSR